jgi:hypothetical protein
VLAFMFITNSPMSRLMSHRNTYDLRLSVSLICLHFVKSLMS